MKSLMVLPVSVLSVFQEFSPLGGIKGTLDALFHRDGFCMDFPAMAGTWFLWGII